MTPNQAQVAWALARAGRPESGLVDYLYENRFDLSYLERVHLLHAMLEAGEKGKRPNALFADLISSVRVDGARVSDRDLVLGPGSYVVQVGKRKFARVTLF